MKILIDADGCPVVDLTIKICKKYNLECIIICDTSHIINRDSIKTITVSKGADSVDYFLVNMIEKGDIAVTQDYGLASMCLARNSFAINQNGLIYDDSNIDSLLMSRYMSQKIRNSGKRLKGPKKRNPNNDKEYSDALIQLIERNLD